MIRQTFKHYEIEDTLGQGGMGVVYRARDTRLNRFVAIKVLSDEFTADPDRRARFLQEARAACAVNHPAIAQIYDADEVDGVTFIAMEFVEGSTVRRLIANRELDLLGAVEIATQIAEGLAKAHAAGIIHRDIKSDNVMVTPDGHAKILDFGLAKLDASGTENGGADPAATIQKTVAATQDGLVVGTIGYMSPEQARGRPLDARSDLFSLGVVLYEMVTGELPFQGESPLDTLHAIAFEETRPVTSIRSNLPVSLHRVVTKCLRKRPDDRYESAESMVRDLSGVHRDIDSGISGGVSLTERARESLNSLREMAPADWMIPVGAIAILLLLSLMAIQGPGQVLPTLLVFGIAGLLIFRFVKNRRFSLVKRFGKKASKMSEVQIVTAQDALVTVVVRDPMAKTYVHLNSMIERVNRRLFFGDPYVLVIRENVPHEELRTMLESPGVIYVSDDVVMPTPS